MMTRDKSKRSFLKRFMRAKKGATALIFSVMAVPVMALAAGVVDYGSALRVKSELTNVLDAAVLAATQAYALDDSVDTTKMINDFIAKNYSDAGKVLLSSDLTVDAPVIDESGEITATLNVKVPTNFLTLVGFNEFDFSLDSSAIVGGRSIEVALVLDNTWSMHGDKLTSLKSSAQTLIDKLMVVGTENVKIALVPFADYVNIGMDNRGEPGLDIPSNFTHSYVKPAGTNCWNTYPDSTRECTNNPYQDTCYADGVPYTCTKSNWSCTGERGTPVEQCEDYPETTKSKDYKWFGCMASRPHDLNVRDEDYATGVPGLMQKSDNICKHISPLTRMTDDKGVVDAAITAMKADNTKRLTNIPTGLAWGWRSISDISPFADGVAYDDDAVTKVIVLMTDGANTIQMRKRDDVSTQNHSGQVWAHDLDEKHGADISVTNGYTAELCSNIKEKGVVIHTIAFDVEEGSSVEDLMKACAANGGQYFDADDADELAAAFKKIALALLNLRLSK